MAEKLPPIQRIQRAHVQIMSHPTFCLYSGVLMIGDVIIDPKCPTAKTDGKNVFYGAEFIDSITDKEINFVVLHENKHKAYRHMTTWKHLWKRNPKIANHACDYVINLQLKDADPTGTFLTIWGPALIDERFRGMNAKEVFEILIQEDNSQSNGGGGGAGSGGSFDEHDWEGAQEMSEAEQKEVEEQILDALRQGSIMVGKKNGTIDRSTLDFLTPKINWREQLRDFFISLTLGKDCTTWSRVNRRFIGQGIYMPGSISESVGPIVIGGDTSGSIVEELKQFLGEVGQIMSTVTPERVDMLWWDSHVAKHEVFLPHEYESFKELTHPAGGGGTTPGCVSQYLSEHKMEPEAIIMMTDGHVFGWGDFSMHRAPVLWVVVGNPHATAPFGKTIHID